MNIRIEKATFSDSTILSELIHEFLTELDQNDRKNADEIQPLCKDLLIFNKIYAFLAWEEQNPIGFITLHEGAAIYAGGLFGEISELYVKPDFRSSGIGQKLINQAIKFGKAHGWQRLEVGAPDIQDWPRTLSFYQKNGFEEVGPRLKKLIEKPQS